jgi:hypothetical protein
VSGDAPLVILPQTSRTLLDALAAVFSTPGLPPVVLVGGLAVTVRVSSTGTAHRATVDVDLVTAYAAPDPEVVELLAAAHQSAQRPLRVAGIAVDVIPTSPLDPRDLEGIGDSDRLFVAGHRWAFEEAEAIQLSTLGGEPLTILVATPAGLVAAKSHAVGHPTASRRATKHGGDLLDVFRLVDIYDADGSLGAALHSGPDQLARLVADVVERAFLVNPAAAANTMATASPTPIDRARVADVMQQFVEELRT